MCPIVCFPFIIKVDRSNSGQTYKNWPFWKVFGGCDLFPQDFRQVWVWIIPHLIEITRASDIFVCRVVFVFICGHDRQRGVLKFKYFGTLVSIFLKFWAGQCVIHIFSQEMVRFVFQTVCLVLQILGNCWNLGKPVVFKYYWPFWSLCSSYIGQVRVHLKSKLAEIIRASLPDACSMDFISFIIEVGRVVEYSNL